MLEIVGRVTRGERVDDKTTVAEWLRYWINEKTKNDGPSAAGRKVRGSTARNYRQHIEDYLVLHLGGVRLARLSAEDISEGFDALLEEVADRDGRKIGGSTIRRIHATLQSSLNAAVRARRMSWNPALFVTLPDVDRPKVRPWEPAELGRFLDHVQGDRLAALFEAMAATGLRRGEALGLRWADVDDERATITVRQQLIELRRGQEPSFGPPKTKSGENRRIELDSRTLGVLLAHQLTQRVERETWGDAYTSYDLVFAREDGRPYEPSGVTKRFGELAAAAKVRHVRLHDLRHGAASLMLASGTPIELVSKILGHSSIAITLDTYSHLLEGVGRRAAEAAVALVPRTPTPPREQSVSISSERTTGPPPGLIPRRPLTCMNVNRGVWAAWGSNPEPAD
ncbi:MAG: tyrosine-type recombinase/integrase [Streptosporangiales bacterium]|nr:tyrosine-type recombinase/integrase [Streptosporangiales bacterium]